MARAYYYYYWYSFEKDSFWAAVYPIIGRDVTPIYEIQTTEQMIDLLKTHKMKHIDDYKGLEDLLKSLGKIEKNDYLTMDSNSYDAC